ncbi:MAG: Crp/Fnr family transcriptional regulator [Saprospiraceae bacterium]|nr:Crp/Fnr family transcriptional regulator [Saprospiraceae bacterium]
MDIQTYQNQFKKVIQTISPISEELWALFIQDFEYYSCSKGDFLTKEGQIEHYLYFVLEGAQRGYHLYKGQEVCIAFSFFPSFSGIPESFISQQPAKYYLQAVSDSKFLRITHHKLQALYEQYKPLERLGRIIAEQVLVGVLERQLELLAYTAEDRYRRLFKQSPHIFQLIPQKYLASYLGMKPETFSRMRKKMLP